ncbi:SAV_915 family protein [Embleya sp. NPDC005971]|uniref:SAV_915 family protein n=1 Tax=Embleya sp. NPDC005971 TaxID=3156724 RepID=UPI0033D3580C
MSDVLITDEEPASTTTARCVLIVPVRSVDGARVVRLCRDPLGARVVVAFTSVARLRAVLGVEQEWIRLGAGAVRSLVDEVGGERLLVDPGLSAAPVRHAEPVAATAVSAGGGGGVGVVPAEAGRRPVADVGPAHSRAGARLGGAGGLGTGGLGAGGLALGVGPFWEPQLLGALRTTAVVTALLVVLSVVG